MRPFSIIVSNHKKIAGNKSALLTALSQILFVCVSPRGSSYGDITIASEQQPKRHNPTKPHCGVICHIIAFLLLLRPLLACVTTETKFCGKSSQQQKGT